MNHDDKKQHDQHLHSAKPGHPADKPDVAKKDVRQNVTTNPHDVGAGGGSTPLGEHGQDSRTWNAAGGNVNSDKGGKTAKPEESDKSVKKVERSNRADAGIADGQDGTGMKQGSEHQDPKATHAPGGKHDRNTM